jgi:Ca2+ transporting ATPase
MLVTVVGKNSALGEIMDKLEESQGNTPLQDKLEVIAEEIGKLGTYAALLTIHILLFRYFLDGLLKRNIDLFGGELDVDRPFIKNFKLWVDYVIIGVAVIVVAVPEGLPLAVMISLAYSQGKMLKDNNYVKKLAACEIMGGATNICSDKTGTLTLNKMKVARVWLDKDVELNLDQDDEGKMTKIDPGMFPAQPWETLVTSIVCNVPEEVGATDKGMTDLLERTCVPDAKLNDAQTKEALEKFLQARRKQHGVHKDEEFTRFEFSSKRKRMSTIISNAGNGGYDKRLLCKGASEYVLENCSHYLDSNGAKQVMSDVKEREIKDIIDKYAGEALRTIALAYRDLGESDFGANHSDPQNDMTGLKDVEKKQSADDGLTLVGILGIYDIIRPEVPGAVATCQKAGVIVRMITGDNLKTAKAIAAKCNLITDKQKEDEEICIEGPEFYEQMGGLICLTCK